MTRRPGSFAARREFSENVKGRVARHRRRPDDLVVLPVAATVLGDAHAEAADEAVGVRRPRYGRRAVAQDRRDPAATEIDRAVQEGACDGSVLVPDQIPGGRDAFVDTAVAELPDRGSRRTEYSGTTLREHLGLRPLTRPAAPAAEHHRRTPA
ncbi:hypothetical protein GCM10023403_05960 [Pseudonocardia benzenivorans]|nr:hypothetical protein PSD17_68380 [Pseudonocardia sp. D17]